MKKVLFLLMTMIVFGFQRINAQDAIKIVTGHPDLKIKVTRCVASGKNVVLDMTVTNMGDTDAPEFGVHGSNWATKIYDDQGNIYEKDIKVKIANKDYTTDRYFIKLVAGVPFKFSIMVSEVSPQAESFVLVEPDIYCEFWSINKDTVKLRNIPISRE